MTKRITTPLLAYSGGTTTQQTGTTSASDFGAFVDKTRSSSALRRRSCCSLRSPNASASSRSRTLSILA